MLRLPSTDLVLSSLNSPYNFFICFLVKLRGLGPGIASALVAVVVEERVGLVVEGRVMGEQGCEYVCVRGGGRGRRIGEKR